MYGELGGRVGYQQTPVRELQECRLSIIAEMNYQAEQEAELKRKQEEQERELERQRRGR
jgi:hypothetical protein